MGEHQRKPLNKELDDRREAEGVSQGDWFAALSITNKAGADIKLKLSTGLPFERAFPVSVKVWLPEADAPMVCEGTRLDFGASSEVMYVAQQAENHPDVVLKKGPTSQASIVAKVPNGQALRLLSNHGDYVEVQWSPPGGPAITGY